VKTVQDGIAQTRTLTKRVRRLKRVTGARFTGIRTRSANAIETISEHDFCFGLRLVQGASDYGFRFVTANEVLTNCMAHTRNNQKVDVETDIIIITLRPRGVIHVRYEKQYISDGLFNCFFFFFFFNFTFYRNNNTVMIMYTPTRCNHRLDMGIKYTCLCGHIHTVKVQYIIQYACFRRHTC
jgi:hypothetical protein